MPGRSTRLKYNHARAVQLKVTGPMLTEFAAALGFILVTTFTPGPNNISSAAMGSLYGYRRTLNYMFGITLGFWIVLFVCALASATVLRLIPGVEGVLRYIGTAYILYLAYSILKASYTFDSETSKPLAFVNGFLLQLFNPKLMVYGVTLFTTFFASITDQPVPLFVTVCLLSLTAFCAVTVWASFGTMIKRYLRYPRARLILNIGLSLLLVYTALKLAGLL